MRNKGEDFEHICERDTMADKIKGGKKVCNQKRDIKGLSTNNIRRKL